MPTFHGQILNSQIILNVGVQDDAGKNEPLGYRALIDTGAQSSAISTKVVSELGLEPIGWREIFGVHGPKETSEYVVKLALTITEIIGERAPAQQTFTRLKDRSRVTELNIESHNFDVLLGMDFLVHFHITIYGDHFILSN